MEAREKQDEKNKRIGWLTSVSIQLVLLVLFYFIVAWKEPFPPIPEYGIELGFTTSAGASSAPSPQQPIEEPEPEPEEASKAVTEEIQTEESQSEETASTVDQPEVVTQEIEDTPVVEEQAENQETVVEDKVEQKETVVEEVPEEEEKLDERAVMRPSEEETDTKENSEGEEETPEIDERALYGSQGENTGTDEGASLALAGWIWDFKPQPNDQSSEIGKIVFDIGVDKNGELVKLKLKTSTVSRAVSLKYEEAIRRLTFSQTSSGQAPVLSNGTITFIIKSK
ncbi:MAG: hypothetical protein AAF391_12480 [Bacteroidota bacterium]